MMVIDMPKLEAPFIREGPEHLVIPKVKEGYEWVFEDDKVMAIEKLHGTNVSIVLTDGIITSVWNRTERLPFFNKGKRHIIEGVMEANARGYCDLEDGQWFGECIGPKINGNPYGLDKHIWIPFKTYAQKHLRYKSWGKYPKTYEAISEWFKDLQPLFSWNFVEGVVFTHPDGRMAKLRRDMFDWFSGPRHKEVDV